MKNIIYLKTLIASVLLTSVCASTSFARTEYTVNTLVTSDVTDSWVVVDYPTMAGNMSTTRGNVVVTVENGVSVKAEHLNVYGTGSSLVFLGNNQVNVGSIALFGGAGSTGSSIEFHNSKVTVSGKITINTGTKLVIDGGSFAADSFSQTGASSIDTCADIKVVNGANLTLNGEGKSYAKQSHNIYVDSTSSFTSTAQDSFYGSLTVEAGATVSLVESSKAEFENITLVLDDTIAGSGSELDLSGFNNIKIGEETIVLSSLSENLVVQDKNGQQYQVSFDESGSCSTGEYIGTAVPEPSTYAMIFGVLSLGFAMYRRRK